jgi:hypothetical protein
MVCGLGWVLLSHTHTHTYTGRYKQENVEVILVAAVNSLPSFSFSVQPYSVRPFRTDLPFPILVPVERARRPPTHSLK